ncbi:hypothetical protein V501_05691 [Pseudogymnoascus sp. VKM F-4519 (FW-2642)]|nr:hypothetical protein V501_05691 [Pseudogymnoascus sp. VKM F-4519 (FW-2642)]
MVAGIPSEHADQILPRYAFGVVPKPPVVVILGTKTDIENLTADPIGSALQHHQSFSLALEKLKSSKSIQNLQGSFKFVESLLEKLQGAEFDIEILDSAIICYGLACLSFMTFLGPIR